VIESATIYQEKGRSAVTLARDGQITVVLEALRKGNELKQHCAPSSATVALISGRATFNGGDGVQERMTPGSLVVLGKDVDHSLAAEEDSAYLITIGGRERSA
jgi:quercetin dioxygenase-like cupin family protein